MKHSTDSIPMMKIILTLWLGSLVAGSMLAQTNVLLTPGFESLAPGAITDNGGVNQWGNYNDTAGNCVVQSSVVHGGANALELNTNPTGSQGYSIVYQNTGTQVPGNQVTNSAWYYSFWVYTTNTTSGTFAWAFFASDSYNEDQAGASGTLAASSLAPGTWTQISGVFTNGTYAFTSGATPEMKATFSQNNSTATFYIDDVVLTNFVGGSTNSGTSSNSAPVLAFQGVTVTVDPSLPLTNYTALGEWNTNGNFQSWTTAQVSGALVANGWLSGAASGTNPQVMITGLSSNGPDLDLAFNDYMDVRLQVPSGFTGGVVIYFGATNNYTGTANATTGFSAARQVTITNVPTDGAFHVYRVFWGPHPYWRGYLSDVRVDPLGIAATTGQAFALDYVRVGDLTGDVYLPRYSSDVPGPGTNDVNGFAVKELDSKHFRFCWDASVASNSFWTATMPHGTLRNFEEVWKNHIWRMGYPETSHPEGSTLPYTGTKYKVNISTWDSGYWTGGDANGTPWVNITPDGLLVDSPTWVPPHEFTHACQASANTNGSQVVDGQFWENNANYGREQWLYYCPWETNQSGLDANYANLSHLWLGHGRDYYLCWPFWLYLDENPDNLPGLGSSYGSFFSVQLWKYARSGEYLWDTLARLAPSNSVPDIIGYVARRNVMWDYSHRSAMTNAYNQGDLELARRWTYAELRQRPDNTNWWQTPLEFAPQQGGYKITRLVPQGSGAGRVVSVNFHGLPDVTGRADWRASLVVVADSGAVRYSGLWNAGTNSVTLAANENTVYLAVAGTPTNFLAEAIDEARQPYASAPAKARFPYEIQVSGATPYESPAATTNGVTMVQMVNGGGWRASTATVDSTAYVGPNARVLGYAQVRGNARILDYATVEGSALVTSNAVVSGHALVRDSAVVRDYAKVRDYGMVIDGSVVSGYARVLQHGEITGGSTITNWATVKGSASTWLDTGTTTLPQAWNDAVLDGDFSTAQSCGNGFQFGFEEYNAGPLGWITNRTAPRRLYAAYEFSATNSSLARDLLGVTDGYLQGNPPWTGSDGQRFGFLTFNGANQYVMLDRSLSDLREISVTAWVKWSGGTTSQPVWYFGSAATNCMYFTPKDTNGSAAFIIINGGTTQKLAWTNTPLPAGQWTHVTVTLSNAATGRLYINGTNVASGGITLTPDQLNAPDVNTSPQQNYLARGAASLPYFQGSLGGIRVYTGALTPAEISALQPPAANSGTGTLYVDLRAVQAAAAGSQTLFATWTNQGSTVGNFTRNGSPAYSTNVAGTGIPGVYFNGTSAYYASANQSVASLTGHGARTLEVWAYNPSLQDEETMVALGDRTGTRTDCAFNFGGNSGWGAATHFGDDVPWGAMGSPSPNGWHHLVYTYDGNVVVKLYVDGLLWYTDILGGVLATPTAEPVYIGCQHGLGQLFSGYINTVRVWGGTMTPAQVAANDLYGPWATLNSTVKPAAITTNYAAITGVAMSSGQVGFQISGTPGAYAVQCTTNLNAPNWTTIFSTNTSVLPFNWTDTNAGSAAMFYRVLVQ